MQFGSVAQGSGGLVYFRTKDLRNSGLVPVLIVAVRQSHAILHREAGIGSQHLQYWVTNKEQQDTKTYQRQTAHVDESSSGENVAFSFVRVVRVWVM